MPTAGYCDQCGRYVWIAPDGSCQNGHPPSAVSRLYEAATAGETIDSGPLADAASNSRLGFAIAGVVVLALALSLAAAASIGRLALPGVASDKGRAAVTYPLRNPDVQMQGDPVEGTTPELDAALTSRAATDYPDATVQVPYFFWVREEDGSTTLEGNVYVEPSEGNLGGYSVVYRSHDKGRTWSNTEAVLSKRGPLHPLAPSLIEALGRHYTGDTYVTGVGYSEAADVVLVWYSDGVSEDEHLARWRYESDGQRWSLVAP